MTSTDPLLVEASAGAGGEIAPAAPVAALRGVSKRFRRADGTDVAALDDVSLDVPAGQLLVLVGPSGCGKTTLLRALAGLEAPDGGVIDIHGEACFDAAAGLNRPPERRRVSMVFQNYALWPHLTALQNVAYPLRADRRTRLRRAEATRRAREMLGVVGIGELADQHPDHLSGGQRQRVALARALVAGSDLVLFDEPLSNVDAQVRGQLRAELQSMQRDLGFSAVFVTHDQVEAMELADRIAVMRHGRVAQLGSPREVYDEPASPEVARFMGAANELAGRVVGVDGDAVEVDTALGPVVGRAGREPVRVGQTVVALWRPEATSLAALRPSVANRWTGVVASTRYFGSHTEHRVVIGGQGLAVWQPGGGSVVDDGPVWIGVEAGAVRVLGRADGDDDGHEVGADAGGAGG